MAGYSLVLQCVPSMHTALGLTTSTTVYTYKCSRCTLRVHTYTHMRIHTCIHVGSKLFFQTIPLFLLLFLTSNFLLLELMGEKGREEIKRYLQLALFLCAENGEFWVLSINVPLCHPSAKLLIAVRQVKSVWQHTSLRWEVLSSVLFHHFLFFRSYFSGSFWTHWCKANEIPLSLAFPLQSPGTELFLKHWWCNASQLPGQVLVCCLGSCGRKTCPGSS